MRRRWALIAVLAVLAGCGGNSAEEVTPPPRTPPPLDVSDLPPNVPGVSRLEVGVGETSAVVLRPDGPPRRPPGVLFLHGWAAVEPEAYGRWIVHLVRAGNQVIYPRYQESAISPPGRAFPAAVTAVRSALLKAPIKPGSLVVTGHSAGGALASDYAAAAKQLGLPPAQGVMSVYPGRRIPGLPLELPEVDPRGIPAGVEVLAFAGDEDKVVGTETARRIARLSGGRYVLVSDDAVDDHNAPQRFDRVARRTFWTPLDKLMLAVRR
jgi:dienelactone hydrolase